MYKAPGMKYIIKSVSSDNPKSLENLLNEMSQAGWDLYSMHEVEADEGFQYNCIFVTEFSSTDEDENEDIINIATFKSQMERMLSPTASEYESCKEIQDKIKEQRKKIAKIKSQLEAQSEVPISKNRINLNNEISKGLKELDKLRQDLIKIISPEAMYSKIRQEKLSISLSEEIMELVDPDCGGVLITETVKLRQKLTENLGYVIPKIIFEDDEKLNPYEFSIKIRGIEALNSFIYPKHLMFFESDLKIDKKQKGVISAIDEISGEKIIWVDEKKTKDFWQKGLAPVEFISRLLEYIIIKNIDELFDYSDINHYMEIVGEKNMFLIENIIPDFVSVAELRYILVNLLREEISIKDIIYIFEKINDFSNEESKEDLFIKLRLSLSRYISKKMSNEYGVIQVLELSEKSYQEVFSQLNTDNDILRIDSVKIGKIIKSISKKVKQNKLDINNLIILVPLEIRHMFFMILSQFITNIKVISKEEIINSQTIEIIDEI
jgi:flagellar biosynthesis protein FlhA